MPHCVLGSCCFTAKVVHLIQSGQFRYIGWQRSEVWSKQSTTSVFAIYPVLE